MSEQDKKLTRDELEAQDGERLPDREVMSTIDLNPGMIRMPEDATLILDDPRPDST